MMILNPSPTNVLPSWFPPMASTQGCYKKLKYDYIMEKKMTTPTDLLCCGFPNKVGIFLKCTHMLCFDDKPDYSYIRKLFRDLFFYEGYQYKYILNWSVQRAQDDGSAGTSGQKVAAGRCLYGPYSCYYSHVESPSCCLG